MAQHKYDLITVPVEPQGPPRHYPWYKERLALKYLQTFRPSASLEGARWAFLPSNIDDCRTGVPVQTQRGGLIVKGKANPVPLIDSRSAEILAKDKRRRRTQPANIHSNPGRHTLFSKVGPRMQAHQAYVSKVEQSLLAHPLGLYPHLEESLPSEMLEDVVGLLDPDLKLTETEVGSETLDSLGSLPGHSVQQQQQQAGTQKQEKSEENGESLPAQTEIYRWPLRQSEEEKERERSLLAIQKVISPTQESRVNQVTHNLVQWGRDLGGMDEKYYMDESTVKRLFSSDYETRPVLTAPIHVVDLVNVPPELQLETQVHSTPSWSYPGERRRRRRRRVATVPGMEMEQPRHVQTRYGAWYLPTNLWRVRPWDEPLQDPREETVGMESEVLARSLAMDEVLSDLHGARAFKEFISTHRPHATMPKFLRNVSKTPKQLTVVNGKSTAVS